MLERIQSFLQSGPHKKFNQVFLLGFASTGWKRLFWISLLFTSGVSKYIAVTGGFRDFLRYRYKFGIFEKSFEHIFTSEWLVFAVFHLAVSFVAHGVWKSKQPK